MVTDSTEGWRRGGVRGFSCGFQLGGARSDDHTREKPCARWREDGVIRGYGFSDLPAPASKIFGWWQSFAGWAGGFSELWLSFGAFLAMAFSVDDKVGSKWLVEELQNGWW